MNRYPVTKIEMIPELRSVLPYAVEIKETRSGPVITLYNHEKKVRSIRVSEALADLIAEKQGLLQLLPGMQKFLR